MFTELPTFLHLLLLCYYYIHFRIDATESVSRDVKVNVASTYLSHSQLDEMLYRYSLIVWLWFKILQ